MIIVTITITIMIIIHLFACEFNSSKDNYIVSTSEKKHTRNTKQSTVYHLSNDGDNTSIITKKNSFRNDDDDDIK